MDKFSLIWLDRVLPVLPIILFVISGIIGYTNNITGVGAWILVAAPVIFSGLWVIWHYVERPKLNLPEQKPLFWKMFGDMV